MRVEIPELAIVPVVTIVIATIFSASVASAKDLCAVPKAEWQSQAALAQKLESEGWKIRTLKIDDGCYEVYGTDGKGKARETHFNPKTFQSVKEE